jgi:membrane protease YdiL (CAAX protease family)
MKLDRKGLVVFLAIAFSCAWLPWTLLWLDPRHLAALWAKPLMAATMFAPSLGTFVVVRWVSVPADVKRATGLVLGRNWLRFWIGAILGTVFFVAAALCIGWASGLLPHELTHTPFYGSVANASPRLGEMLVRWPRASVLVFLMVIAPIAPLNGIFTFGEEWGWRGWLLPNLLPLGQWRALVLSGVIWGVWHAPVIALGYNYPLHHTLGPVLMIGFCVILGILFGWTRLETGSIWPSVIAHAVLNAIAGAHLLLGPETSVDTAQATILGWTGWILPVAFIGWLAATRRITSARPDTSTQELAAAR